MDTRLLRQAKGTLADDVPLDLAGARIDGAGPAAQEHTLPGADRIAVALRPQQPVAALDRHRDLAELLVVLGPEQLGHRGLGAWLLPGRDLGEGTQPAESHDLDLGVGPGELLAHERIGVPAPLPRGLGQLPELPLVSQVLNRRPASPLVPERGHGDLPAVAEPADDV